MHRLEQMLTEKIADMYGVPVDSVTLDFIEAETEKLWNDPDHKIVGDDASLKYVNRTELQYREERTQRFLAERGKQDY